MSLADFISTNVNAKPRPLTRGALEFWWQELGRREGFKPRVDLWSDWDWLDS